MAKDSQLSPSVTIKGATEIRDWSKDLGGKASVARRNNPLADRLPNVNDDSTQGYGRGSTWIYNDEAFILTDSTQGQAKWVSSSGGGGASYIKVPNTTARKALTSQDVKVGDIVQEENTGYFYLVADIDNLDKDSGWVAQSNSTVVAKTPTWYLDGNGDWQMIEGDIPDLWQENNSGTKLSIGTSVTSIGIYAFSNNSLTSVTIPNSVTRINSFAFAGTNITSLILPNSVTSLGYYDAFSSCRISSLTLSKNLTDIPGTTFAYNKLTSVTIPDNIVSIGHEAFANNMLTSVTIGSGVTNMGGGTFISNPSLSLINCYTTLTTIGNTEFIATAEPLTIHARANDATWTEGTGLPIGGNDNVTVIKDL